QLGSDRHDASRSLAVTKALGRSYNTRQKSRGNLFIDQRFIGLHGLTQAYHHFTQAARALLAPADAAKVASVAACDNRHDGCIIKNLAMGLKRLIKVILALYA